jgi:hypothetical protein
MWNPLKQLRKSRQAPSIQKGDIPDTEAAIRFAMRENHRNDMACFREEATMFPLPREAANGTCGQGTIETTYKELKAVFGQPTGGSADGKVRKSWCFHIDGIVCTIYDWKTKGRTLKSITRWNVGGSSRLSYHLVRMAIMDYRLSQSRNTRWITNDSRP